MKKREEYFRSESIALRRSFLSICHSTNVLLADVRIGRVLLNLEAPTDILVLAFASHTVIISTSAAATTTTTVQKWIRRVHGTWK